MALANDYTTQAMVDRIALKAFTSSSSSLSAQQIVDLANDSLRSYIVPLASTLREEWWVGKTDIVVVTDANGAVTVPDSVASSLRTVAWKNGGVLTPLSRIEPEASFQYLAMQGSLPVGFELRGYTLLVLPKVAGVELHLSAMLRPSQMVLTENAGQVSAQPSASQLTIASVPLAWQPNAPNSIDVISGTSPFSSLGTFDVIGFDFPSKTFSIDGSVTNVGVWVADVGASPFANVPIELYPLLELDVVETLYQGLGDKRLKGVSARKKELEALAKRTMGPRTTGNARPIVNPNAPGMRGGWRR